MNSDDGLNIEDFNNLFGGRPTFPFGTRSQLRKCVRVRVTLPLEDLEVPRKGIFGWGP